MIINHNCCIKLVRLVIFIYDARSHIHQSPTECDISECDHAATIMRRPWPAKGCRVIENESYCYVLYFISFSYFSWFDLTYNGLQNLPTILFLPLKMVVRPKHVVLSVNKRPMKLVYTVTMYYSSTCLIDSALSSHAIHSVRWELKYKLCQLQNMHNTIYYVFYN